MAVRQSTRPHQLLLLRSGLPPLVGEHLFPSLTYLRPTGWQTQTVERDDVEKMHMWKKIPLHGHGRAVCQGPQKLPKSRVLRG